MDSKDLQEIVDAIADAEEDIRRCQDLIDKLRSLYPNDQKFQLNQDRFQVALDERKERVRIMKTAVSMLTE